MGLLLIFFGVLVTGVVADYVVENDLLTLPNQTIVLLGTRVTVSGAAVVVGAFLAGMLALLLVLALALVPRASPADTSRGRRVVDAGRP